MLAGCADSPAGGDRASPRSRVAGCDAHRHAFAVGARHRARARLVVVGHATRLSSTSLARRHASSPPAGSTRWHGLRVVRGLPADGRWTPSNVTRAPWPSYRSRPWGRRWWPRRVGGVDPVRDHPGARDLLVVGDVMLSRGVPDPAAALAPMSQMLRRADLTVGNLESTLSTRGEPTQGGDSFGGSPQLARTAARCRVRRAVAGEQPRGRLRRTALLDTVGTLARSPIVPFGAGENAAAASRPAVIERGGVRFGFVGFNAIGETPRGGSGHRRSASASGCRRGPDRWCRRTWTGCCAPYAGPPGGPTSSWCSRTGARSTPTCPSRSSAGSAATLVRAGADLVVGRSPALGAGRGRGRRRAGAALAGQLRLRHGLHGADDGGRGPRGDVLGRGAQGRPAAAVPDGPGELRAAHGSAVPLLRGSSTTCGRPARDRSPLDDRSMTPASSPAQPGHHRPSGPFQLGPVDHGRHVRPPSGSRRTAYCPAARRGARRARRTSGRWLGCWSAHRPGHPRAGPRPAAVRATRRARARC